MPHDPGRQPGFLTRLQRRGVPRVAVGYAVIAWLLLQIGDVVLDPLDAPAWVMRALIFVLIAGFPVSMLLAWFLELGSGGVSVDRLPEGAERPSVSGLRRYADIIIIVVLVGIIAVLLARQEGLLDTEPELPVLAVLPFEEIGKTETGYFGAGLADTLSGKLGELEQLIVLASTSTREFQGHELDIARVGSKLGATALLLGSVQRAGGQLRVNTRLVDPRSGQQLWTRSYDREATDLFAVQDDIAHAVTRSLALVLTDEQSVRLARAPTHNLTAYEAYLRGMDDLASRDYDRLARAIRYLRDAIALDPEYAMAHAGLPQALFLAASYRSWDTVWEEVRDEAQEAAEKALALDPDLGEAWFAKAMVMIGDIEHTGTDYSREELVAILEKALELSPNNSAILKQLANYQTDEAEAMRLLEWAARIDPRSGIIRANIAQNYSRLGQHEKGEQWLFEAARTQEPYFVAAYKLLAGLDRFQYRQLDRSARWARAYYQRYPDDWAAMSEYTRNLLELGYWEELDRVLQVILAKKQPDEAVAWVGQLMHIRSLRAQGLFEPLPALIQAYVREQLLGMPTWPDRTQLASSIIAVFEAEALALIHEDKADTALENYLEAYSDPTVASLGGAFSDTLRAPVMIAALYRLNGQEEEAEALLRLSLERLDAPDMEPSVVEERVGFNHFIILAMLGETDVAIDALEERVKAGWLIQWWGLKDAAAFDANYAAVVADPRFERLYEEIVGRVTKMRESFESDPDLPQEVLQQAGLAIPAN